MNLVRLFLAMAALLTVVEWRRIGGDPERVAAEATADYYYLTLGPLLALRQADSTVLVDARDQATYRRGHIPGALSAADLGLGGPEGAEDRRLRQAESVVVYCSGTSCDASLAVARLLVSRGWRHVAIYGNGYAEWQSTGLAIESGEPAP